MEKVGCSLIQLMIGISLICGIEAARRRLGPMHAAEASRVTQADVNLYMAVMRSAAERVRNPAPQDLATMAAFQRIRDARSSPATKLTPEEKHIIQRAFLITNALDEVVAQEKHVDTDRYRSAKAAVESVLPAADQQHRIASGAVTPAERQVLKSKGAALAPWAREIRELQDLVFNNSFRQTLTENTPTSAVAN